MYRGGQAVTALGCSITRPTEALVGLADHTVRCIALGEFPSLSPSPDHGWCSRYRVRLSVPSEVLPGTPLSSLTHA